MGTDIREITDRETDVAVAISTIADIGLRLAALVSLLYQINEPTLVGRARAMWILANDFESELKSL